MYVSSKVISAYRGVASPKHTSEGAPSAGRVLLGDVLERTHFELISEYHVRQQSVIAMRIREFHVLETQSV